MDFIKYDDDHFVLRMSKRELTFLRAALAVVHPESETELFDGTLFHEVSDQVKNTDGGAPRVIFDAVSIKIVERASQTEPVSTSAETWPVYRNTVARMNEEDRPEFLEKLTAAKKYLGDRMNEFAQHLDESFLFDDAPDSDYWIDTNEALGASAEALVGKWPLWTNLERVIPSDRREEVARNLLVVEDTIGVNREQPLDAAFTWDASPQGHTWWSAWNARRFSPNSPVPGFK